jgi:hypothetical protein
LCALKLTLSTQDWASFSSTPPEDGLLDPYQGILRLSVPVKSSDTNGLYLRYSFLGIVFSCIVNANLVAMQQNSQILRDCSPEFLLRGTEEDGKVSSDLWRLDIE